MSVLTQILHKIHPQQSDEAFMERLAVKAKKVSEVFWFTTTLALFIVMGPFSVIAAVAGVLSVIPGEEGGREPEPVH